VRGTHIDQLFSHFFRHEYGRLVSILTRSFGVSQLDLIEDAVQMALLEALETWALRGVPENPAAWLFRVAKNKTIDVIRREAMVRRRTPDAIMYQESGRSDVSLEVFGKGEDGLLRMMFACCDPSIPVASQVALTLKTLCGFSAKEIASALLVSIESVHKRIQRAKHYLKGHSDFNEIPTGRDLDGRMVSVRKVLYLLFNGGYASSHSDEHIRRDLCEEAIRLSRLSIESSLKIVGATWALHALMLLQAARLSARVGTHGGIILLEDQDRSLWDTDLIDEGIRCIERSSETGDVTTYHLEAAIALHHCTSPSVEETDWEGILNLYEMLLDLQSSPIYELNRAIVLAKIKGPNVGIKAIRQINDPYFLQKYHWANVALGQLFFDAGNINAARQAFESALAKTESGQEKELLRKKISSLPVGES
jgi:RNA polymerase sigma factor (sigma-70 family)